MALGGAARRGWSGELTPGIYFAACGRTDKEVRMRKMVMVLVALVALAVPGVAAAGDHVPKGVMTADGKVLKKLPKKSKLHSRVKARQKAGSIAHTQYGNTTIGNEATWSNGIVTDYGNDLTFANLACGQQAVVNPGQTRWIRNHADGLTLSQHFGLGAFEWPHIHGYNDVYDNNGGPLTKLFVFVGEYPAFEQNDLGSKRESVATIYGVLRMVKFNHNGPGNNPVIVQANC